MVILHFSTVSTFWLKPTSKNIPLSYIQQTMLYNTQPAATTAQHKLSKNTHTMIPPGRWLPDAPSLKVSTIHLHYVMAHDLRNMAMQFFYMKLTYSLFCLYSFYRQWISAPADNRYVFLVKPLASRRSKFEGKYNPLTSCDGA
jgi:hypothetical protein